MQIKGHTDDVNAIAYLDDSNNILISGSDDTFVKVCPSTCIAVCICSKGEWHSRERRPTHRLQPESVE